MPAQNAMGLLFGIIQILKVDGLTIPKLYEFIDLYISFKIFKRFRHVAIKHLRKKSHSLANLPVFVRNFKLVQLQIYSH